MVTRPELERWQPFLLQQAAAKWRTCGQAVEKLFDDYATKVNRVADGRSWTGLVADSATDRAYADRSNARKLADKIDALASKADSAYWDVSAKHRSALDAIHAAESDGFSVGSDFSVTDSRSVDEADRAERENALRTHVETIGSGVTAAVAADKAAADLFTGMRGELTDAFTSAASLSGGQASADARELMEHPAALTPEMRKRLIAAGSLTPQQLDAMKHGGQVTISASQMEYLNSLSNSLDGKSPQEIKGILDKLPAGEKQALGNAMELLSNKRVTASVEGNKDVPTHGDLSLLPKQMVASLNREPLTQGASTQSKSGSPNNTASPLLQLNGLKDNSAIADVVGASSEQYRAGSEIDRKLASVGAEYLHAKVQAEQSLLPEIGITTDDGAPVSSIEKIFGAVGPDKAVVNEMVTNHSTGMQFVNDLQTANWSDDGRSAASLFQFGHDADPRSTAEIMNAVGQASSTPDAWKLLSAIPGEHPQTVGEMNPEIVRTLAKSMAPYISDLAGGTEHDGFGYKAWDSPSGQTQHTGAANIFAMMNTDPDASKFFNGAAYNEQLAMAAVFAHDPDDPEAGRALGIAGQIQGLIDKGAVTEVNNPNIEDARKEIYDLKSAAFDNRKSVLDTGLGLIPGVGPYAQLGSQMTGQELKDLMVGSATSGVGTELPHDLMGPEDENFKWAVLRAAGGRIHEQFGGEYPYAFGEDGHLLTSQEMDNAKMPGGQSVDSQSAENAIRQMFHKFAGDTDTTGYRDKYDDVTRATASTPPKR